MKWQGARGGDDLSPFISGVSDLSFFPHSLGPASPQAVPLESPNFLRRVVLVTSVGSESSTWRHVLLCDMSSSVRVKWLQSCAGRALNSRVSSHGGDLLPKVGTPGSIGVNTGRHLPGGGVTSVAMDQCSFVCGLSLYRVNRPLCDLNSFLDPRSN